MRRIALHGSGQSAGGGVEVGKSIGIRTENSKGWIQFRIQGREMELVERMQRKDEAEYVIMIVVCVMVTSAHSNAHPLLTLNQSCRHSFIPLMLIAHPSLLHSPSLPQPSPP